MTQPIHAQTNAEKGASFERRVAELFRMHGYEVETDVQIAGRQVDMVVERRQAILSQRYIVECKNQADNVGVEAYDAFKSRLESARRLLGPGLRGILVSSVGFTRQVREQGRVDEIDLLTISRLEQTLFDPSRHIRHLLQALPLDEDLAWYVEPSARRAHVQMSESAFDLFDQWLANPQTNQLTILGDYGTGKTTFLKHIALFMARRYDVEVLQGGARGRLPVLVNLRDHPRVSSLQDLVLGRLREHGVEVASYEGFEYAMREGQLLVLLDGFDEMASRGDPEETLRTFRAINRCALGRAKIVLTSRSHYFVNDAAVQRMLGEPAPTAVFSGKFTQLYQEIVCRKNFRIIYMEDFNDRQVTGYLERRCGAGRARELRLFIRSKYNLEELSRRPVLLDMIVERYDRLTGKTSEVTPSFLYQMTTDEWLERNDWCSALTVGMKAELLEWFAGQAASRPDFQLHHKRIPELIRAWNPSVSDLDTGSIDRELRTASFLVCDAEGNYAFSHRSFQDFFYARYLLSMARKGRLEPWGHGFFRTEVYRFLRDMIRYTPDAFDELLGWLDDTGQPWLVRANAVKCAAGMAGDPCVWRRILACFRATDDRRLRPHVVTALGYTGSSEVIDDLITVVRDEPDAFTRGNAMTALARIDQPRGMAFVVGVLSGAEEGVDYPAHARWPLFRAAVDLKRPDLTDAILRSWQPGSRLTRQTKTIDACLRLAEAYPSAAAREYCLRVLKCTANPRLAATAFELLPGEERARHFSRVVELYEANRKSPYRERLVRCLHGVRDESVGRFLAQLVETNALAAPPVTFELLAEDYQEIVAERIDRWSQRGNPYMLRAAVARELVRKGGADDLAKVEMMLAPRERPVLKREVLQLLYEIDPRALVAIVGRCWPQEPTPYVARLALELVRKADPAVARKLMLTAGVSHRRVGTRVAVCDLLGADLSPDATNALLGRLTADDDRWVRRQALVSLLIPGREMPGETIRDAMSREEDGMLRELARELLGKR